MLLNPVVITKVVSTAGIREQLMTSNKTVPAILIQALSSNTGKIYIGDGLVSSSNGIELFAGDSIRLSNDDLGLAGAEISCRDIWIDSSINGEGITALYLERK